MNFDAEHELKIKTNTLKFFLSILISIAALQIFFAPHPDSAQVLAGGASILSYHPCTADNKLYQPCWGVLTSMVPHELPLSLVYHCRRFLSACFCIFSVNYKVTSARASHTSRRSFAAGNIFQRSGRRGHDPRCRPGKARRRVDPARQCRD